MCTLSQDEKCSVRCGPQGLRSRTKQQIKKLVITGFIENITSGEFLGGGAVTKRSVHLPMPLQLQNRITVAGSSLTDHSGRSSRLGLPRQEGRAPWQICNWLYD